MATTTTTASTQPSNSSDAHFRKWAKHIHDSLTAAGWVNTADTGQINLATVTAPGAANTEQGYEIWRMNDALQGTYPVFLRIGYGSANATNNPGIWLEIGTGSDGSGAITGRIWRSLDNGTNAWVGSAFDSAVLGTVSSFGVGTTSSIGILMFGDQSSSNYLWAFSIERTKTSAGADSADGVIVFSSTLSSSISRSKVFRFDSVNRQQPDSCVNYILDATNVALAGLLPADGGGVPFSGLYAFHDYAYPWSGMWIAMRTNHANPGAASVAVVTAADRFGVRSKFLMQSGLTPNGLAGNDTQAEIGMYWGAV